VKNYTLFFILWILAIVGYLSIVEHKEIRYLLPVALPIILLGVKGLFDMVKELSNNKIIRSIGSVVMIIAILSLSGLNTDPLSGPMFNYWESPTQKAADQLNALNNTDSHIIYSNQNYPVLAYYTNYNTTVVRHQDVTFYSEYHPSMNQTGYFVHYKDLVKQPTQEWLENATDFKNVWESEYIAIYEFRKL